MKIDNSGQTLSGVGVKKPTPNVGQGSNANKPQVAQTTTSTTKDSVAINPRASQLNALASSLDGLGVADQARVDAIKQAISQGRFQINPEAIADKLIASTKELLAGGE